MVMWSGHGYVVFILWSICIIILAAAQQCEETSRFIVSILAIALFLICNVGIWVWGRGAHRRPKRDEFAEENFGSGTRSDDEEELGDFVPDQPQRHTLYFVPVEYWGLAGILLVVIALIRSVD